MIKVTGSIALTLGSGSGSRRPKNIRIRIRIRNRNTRLHVPELVADLAEQLIVVIRGALLTLSPDPESDPDPQHWLDVPELVADLTEHLIVVIRGALLALSGSGVGSATLARCT
jgi:hypothetical protein